MKSVARSFSVSPIHRFEMPNLPTRGRKSCYRRHRRVITRALNYRARFFAARLACAFYSPNSEKEFASRPPPRASTLSLTDSSISPGLLFRHGRAIPHFQPSLIPSPPRPFRSRYVNRHYHISHTSYLTLAQNSLTLAVNTPIFFFLLYSRTAYTNLV